MHTSQTARHMQGVKLLKTKGTWQKEKSLEEKGIDDKSERFRIVSANCKLQNGASPGGMTKPIPE